MAFPDGWKYKCALTIDHTLVSADLTNFPVFLDSTNLPSTMMDSDLAEAALEGGGDIRFSSDSAGATRLACEVVHFARNSTPSSAIVEIHVKIPTISSSTNTTFYVWWGKAAETQPAVTDTYGRNAVWTGAPYSVVMHMSENNSLADDLFYDATGKGNDMKSGTDSRTPSRTTGNVGYGQEFDDTNNDMMYRSDVTLYDLDSNTFCFSIWFKRTSTSGGGFYDRLLSRNDDRFDISINGENSTGQMHFISNGAGATQGWQTTGHNADSTDWTHYAASHNSGTTLFYKNGGDKQTKSYTVNHQNRGIGVGCKIAGSESLDVILDEARWAYGTALSDAWIEAEYNTLNSPSTFITEGTVISVGNIVKQIKFGIDYGKKYGIN